jgi:hypothetical protein
MQMIIFRARKFAALFLDISIALAKGAAENRLKKLWTGKVVATLVSA